MCVTANKAAGPLPPAERDVWWHVSYGKEGSWYVAACGESVRHVGDGEDGS